MFRNRILTLIVLFGLVLGTACQAAKSTPTPAAQPNMANPASVNCEQKGGKVDIRTDATGAQAGVCVFPDGSECDEWAYFRGECQPGDSLKPAGDQSAPAAEELGADGWMIYRDEPTGLIFHYPTDAEIVKNDDPLSGLTIQGPLVGEDHWPVLGVTFPADREEYRPPEGADLLQWLTDHNLLGENRQGDTQIAGTSALHFRHERSPQSFAADSYFFAQAGQLYKVDILHTGDKEDWNVYNQFLQSIQFEK